MPTYNVNDIDKPRASKKDGDASSTKHKVSIARNKPSTELAAYHMSRPAVYAMTQLECEELLPDDSALTRISSTEGSSAGTGEAMVKNASMTRVREMR